jgi:hypothetical protein
MNFAGILAASGYAGDNPRSWATFVRAALWHRFCDCLIATEDQSNHAPVWNNSATDLKPERARLAAQQKDV